MTVANGAPAPAVSAGAADSIRSRIGGRAFRIGVLLLPVGVLANVVYTVLATDADLLASLGALPRAYLLAAVLLTLTPWLTGTARLFVWTRFLGQRIPLRDVFRMTLVVDLGAAVSPTAIGGEAFRWGMLMQHGVRPGTAASLALLPKLEDAAFFAIAIPTAIIWTSAWRLPLIASSARLIGRNALTVLVVALVLGVLSWAAYTLVARRRRWRRRRRAGRDGTGRGDTGRDMRLAQRLRAGVRDAGAVLALVGRRGKTRFGLTLSLTALHWAARYSVISALALFLGVPFDPVLFWLLQWVVFTVMSFVPTPGAAGGAEVAFTAVYATMLPAGVIGVATAAWRVFTFYVPVALAALVFALTSERSPRILA